MLNGYHIFTVTHHQTPLRLIGQFVLTVSDEAELRRRLSEARAVLGIEELMYLATCNRVLICIYREQPIEGNFAQQLFDRLGLEINPMLIEHHVQHLQGDAAIEHLMRVAASIDSLVVGEREILRQLREAYDQCKRLGLTGDNLRLLMQQAVVAAKAVYSQTRLGEKSVSVVSLAIRQMLDCQISRHARIVLVGAGQTNTLVCKFLKKYGFENITIFNRTLDKAQQLARQFTNGRALRLSELPRFSEGFDCLIVCTAATTPIIDAELYQKLLHNEQGNKVVIDLSIPNNVCPTLPKRFSLRLIEIESLKQLAQENMAFRQREVQNAEALLKKNFEAFKTLYQTRLIERAFLSIPAEVRAVKEKALHEVFKKDLEKLDGQARQLVEQIVGYMEKKCSGIPMRVAREAFVNKP